MLFTSQILLSEPCSWPNVVDAPKTMVTRLMIVAVTPEAGWLARSIMSSIVCAPAGPIVPWSWPTISPCAASRPNTSPAIAITSTSSGAIEKIV